MTEKRVFWRVLEVGAILLYAVIIGGSYLLGQARPGWILMGLLVLLHLTETPTALHIGHEKGLSALRVFVMNMLFGFTWWVPLRRGILQK